MSSPSFNFLEILWLFFSVTVGVLMITASILLLRERHVGVWMLLIGSILSTLAGVASRLSLQLLSQTGNHEMIAAVMQSLGLVGGIGWLLMGLGLLLFALHRRAQS